MYPDAHQPQTSINDNLAYHVTPIENLPSIQASGLRAQIGARSEGLEIHAGVFVFPTLNDCDTALGQWLGEEFEDIPENGLAILEVDIAGLPYAQDVVFEKQVLADIPTERIRRVLGENYLELSHG